MNLSRISGEPQSTPCSIFSFACFVTYDKSGKHIQGRIYARQRRSSLNSDSFSAYPESLLLESLFMQSRKGIVSKSIMHAKQYASTSVIHKGNIGYEELLTCSFWRDKRRKPQVISRFLNQSIVSL